MRMDRYEDPSKNTDEKTTRLNKNQELYTDVYMNNVYVDIDKLEDVMKEDEDNKLEVKRVKDLKFSDYTYEEKNYDIVKLVNDAISNKDEEGIKGSFDFKSNEESIKNVLDSINEKAIEEKKEKQSEDLMSDLMPSNENTDVLPAVSETEDKDGEVELEPLPETTNLHLKAPITDTSLLELPEVKTEEVCLDMLNEVLENEKDKDIEVDESFREDGKNKYIKLIIVLVIILILVATAIVLKLLHVF